MLGFSVAALLGGSIWLALYLYDQYRTNTILESIEEQKTVFSKSIEQTYLPSQSSNEQTKGSSRRQIYNLMREQESIQKDLVLNLPAAEGEPTRVFRRQFILSHATLADSSNRR